MKKRILIFGASGKIGHTLFSELSTRDDLSVYGVSRLNNLSKYLPSEFSSKLSSVNDVNNLLVTRQILEKIKPDIVINAVGIIKQIKESENLAMSLEVNSIWPHRLALLCAKRNIRVIQLSSDCVYSGSKGDYIELDTPDATDVYGKTKWLGELYYPNSITLRTSTIGHEIFSKNGLIEWLLDQSSEIKGYTNAIFSGLSTVELAKVISDYVIPNSKLTGLYHLSTSPISKYTLLGMVVERYNKKINIKPYEIIKIDRSLNAARFYKETGYIPPKWKELINEMYNHYQNSSWYRK